MMMTWITKAVLLVMLLFFTVTDIRKQQIYVPLAAALGLAGIIWHIALPGRFVMESVWGIGIGLLVCLISRVSRGAIGMGDGMVVAACGSWLGLVGTVELFLLALVLAGAWSVILLVRGKGRGASFPFMPFLLVAHGLLLFQ